jgi:hypothetical protein
MAINELVKSRSCLAILVAITLNPAWAISAQVAKVPATKERPGKAAPAKEDNAAWQLAGREGECAPLSLLEKKGAQYKDVRSPYQLAEKLHAAGYKADVKEFKAGSRPAVEVRAPDAGIHVMFVKQENCDKKPPVPEKK